LDENVIMTTIYVKKQHPDKDDEEVTKPWFDFQPTTDADRKRLASRAGMRELVASAAIDKAGNNGLEYKHMDFANEVNLYVLEEKEFVVITNANFEKKTKGVVEFYAYVPAPPAPTTANNEGDGGDQGKLVCCDCLIVLLLVCAFLDHVICLYPGIFLSLCHLLQLRPVLQLCSIILHVLQDVIMIPPLQNSKHSCRTSRSVSRGWV
jgi:hypothetical protein